MTELTVTRKDLEDAAKAFDKGIYYSDLMGTFHERVNGDEWWPAEDPGDAFELAFKLNMIIDAESDLLRYKINGITKWLPIDNIKEACKAIVLAAAEIWRAKNV